MVQPGVWQHTLPAALSPGLVSAGFGDLQSGGLESLEGLLEANGLGGFLPAFVKQEVGDMKTAMSLSLEEVRTVLQSHSKVPTVGAVRSCHRVLSEAARRRLTHHNQFRAEPTPQSVLSRSLLQLSPDELKGALNEKLNAESIFASLMLTIAAGALIEIPDPEVCEIELGSQRCDALWHGYMIGWGVASCCFATACLVSLGSVQIFFGHASASDVHDRFIGSEPYQSLSQGLITLGLVLGLLPGLCFNMFLRLPQFPWACGFISLLYWLLWLLQLIRGIQSIKIIYGEFPGFGTAWQFVQGYVPFRKTIKLVPRHEPQHDTCVLCSAQAVQCEARDCYADLEAQSFGAKDVTISEPGARISL